MITQVTKLLRNCSISSTAYGSTVTPFSSSIGLIPVRFRWWATRPPVLRRFGYEDKASYNYFYNLDLEYALTQPERNFDVCVSVTFRWNSVGSSPGFRDSRSPSQSHHTVPRIIGARKRLSLVRMTTLTF